MAAQLALLLKDLGYHVLRGDDIGVKLQIRNLDHIVIFMLRSWLRTIYSAFLDLIAWSSSEYTSKDEIL